MEDLPNRVREWRLKRNLSLRGLAPLVGLSHAALGRMEVGTQEMNQQAMERIAGALQVQPADLLKVDAGGLTEDERRMIDTYREVPEVNRRVIASVFEGQQGFRGPPEISPFPPQDKRAGE